MKQDDKEESALQVLRTLAALAALNLSLEERLTAVIGKVSEATWERVFQKVPAWYDFYFQSPLEAFKQFQKSPTAKMAFELDPSIQDPIAQSLSSFINAEKVGQEAIGLADQLTLHEGQVEFELNDEEIDESLQELVLFKAIVAETRARSFYGQGMFEFIAAGKQGNDDGYFRAVAIDPTIQWHPSLAERISRDSMAGKGEFADKLRKAATVGPSKNISKDFHQLRYILSLLREIGQLKALSDADRYELFCHRLGLYPDSGENPKAALCTFIDRWERSLVV